MPYSQVSLATGMEFSDKEKFPYFFRSGASIVFHHTSNFNSPFPIPRTVPSDIFQAKAMLEVLKISSTFKSNDALSYN